MYFKIVMFCICYFLQMNFVCAQNKRELLKCASDEYYQQQVMLHPEILDNEKRILMKIESLKNDRTMLKQKSVASTGIKKYLLYFI